MIRVKLNAVRQFPSILLSLCLLAGGLTAAVADTTPATVVVGEKPVPFVVSPYVDNGLVYVPVDVVHLMGATYAPNPDGKTVKITPGSGASFDVPFQFVRSRFCVPLLSYASQLGATAKWDDRSHTLTFRAKLVMVHADDSGLTVTTSYPVYYKVNKLDKETKQDPIRRIYVDLTGVDLAASPTSIPSTEPGIAFIRTGYVGGGVARIVVDLKRKLDFKVDSAASTSNVRVAMAGLDETAPPPHVAPPPPTRPNRNEAHRPQTPPVLGAGGQTPPVVPVQTTPIAPLPVTVPPSQTATTTGDVTPAAGTPTESTGTRIVSIGSNVVSPEVTEVTVKTTSATKYRWLTLDAPYRLAFDLAGAGLDPSLTQSQQVASSIVKDVRAGSVTAGTTQFGRVVIDLSQAVDFSVTAEQADDGMVYTISLQKPMLPAPVNINGQLHGKVVMVDPGHGADDAGALDTVNGYREKDFNLSIAKKVRDTLARAGATVYMTREDDIKPSVNARPKMGIAVGADFFVSIHCDESGARDSHAGTTVYYHAHKPECMRLASFIVHRVSAVSGLSSNGTKSDTIRFQTGFGVLRGSPMPAVLVECGYMNNNGDVAKLKTDQVQQHIADGVVSGLIDFVTSGG